MSASMAASTTGQELARNMSLFEIDEALVALVESAQDEAAANGGELSGQLRTALADFCLYGCFSRPQLLVLGGGAAAVSKNPARVPVEVRHRRGLPTVSSRLPLAGRLRLPALCPPAGV